MCETRVLFCLEQYLARCKVSDDLLYVISFDADFEALTATCNAHLALRTNTVFVHVISYRYGENATPAPSMVLPEDARHNANGETLGVTTAKTRQGLGNG